MDRLRRRSVKAGLCCVLALAGASAAKAQSQTQTQTGTASSFGVGLGLVPQFGSSGSTSGQPNFAMMPIPMMTTTTGAATTGAAATASTRAADPLGLGFVYGPAAIPMTPGQAGLFMLSASSRMTGLGNGQLSGVRPGGPADTQNARRNPGKPDALVAAAHTRNSNIPGGQAARYFNRGATPATARSQPYYRRDLRYFPKTGQ
jgi:hypothetical protein